MLDPYEFHLLGPKNVPEIQEFLNLLSDFFLLCEGEKGEAGDLLRACPPGKNASQDKSFIGIYTDKILVGLIDLIQRYPQDDTWTIGYLLIHPAYRNKNIGSYALEMISGLGDFRKLRCVVQDQNPQALKFWQNNHFVGVSTLTHQVKGQDMKVLILEKEIMR